MGMHDYEAPAGRKTAEISAKGSRFIGVSMPCPDGDSVRANLDSLAKEYPGATHYCYAAVFGGADRTVRFSDAGEPSGTAGKPILSVLAGSGLSDAMVAVIRYFGGTLLGTGGLVRAYSEAASLALKDAERKTRRVCAVFSFVLDYSQYSAFESGLRDLAAKKPECEYSDAVKVKAWVPAGRAEEFLGRLDGITAGKACPNRLPDEYAGRSIINPSRIEEGMLIKAQSIAKSFGPVKVLADVSLQINEGDAIGLIGVNGAGKSTFLKILLGEMKPDTGELTRYTERIGYLEQFAESSAEFTVRDVLGRPYGHIENIRRRLAEIEEEMASGGDIDWNALAEESARLESLLSKSDADSEANQKAALEKVGLSADMMERTMDSLSGGERAKVMLSRIVVQADDCDLLVMDEPTSHLDINTVEWLEDYLLKTRCAFLVISHDRYFLDKMATRMLEISNGKSREYKGNYSDFIMKKMLDLDRMEKEYRKYSSQKRKQEEIAKELHHDQWFMAAHKTREKMIARMEEKEKPEESREITVRIQTAQKSGKNVITAKDLSVSLGGKKILEHVDLDIQKGDRVGIFGSNGEGKTTLVKALLEQIPSEGELWTAPGARIGYYSQHHDSLDKRLTAEEQLLQLIGKERRGEARAMLARFLLTGDDVDRPISTLSGGQRARVAMCLLLLEETNLLVLDEPTNYLDIPAKHAIEEALNEYGGTVIAVTHDRYFLDTVCTSVIEVSGGRIKTFAGTYSAMKGRPSVREVVMDADEYRVLSPFTNWTTGRKYAKGERVLITPAEQKSFEWALGQGKLKKTGGRQRKKVGVPDSPPDTEK